MNKRQAEQAGYEFTGIYERSYDKQIVLDKAKELRKAGNKAITVRVPDSKYSRSSHGGCGFSVYWIESEANREIRLAKVKEQKRKNIKARIEELYIEIDGLEAELAEL